MTDPARTIARVHVGIDAQPLDLAAPGAFVADPACGGVAQFVGVVRDHHAGDAVDHLVYEAWRDEALPRLQQVADDVVARFPGVRAVWVEHRTGRLDVGEAAVVVAASAPHRDEAFDAARALIDRTKAEVPIWKHEHLADGTSRWPGADDC